MIFSIKEEKRLTKTILTVVSLLFFLICLFSILKYGNSTLMGSLDNPNNDDVKFIRSAWTLAQTGNYTYHRPPNPTVFMMPGAPFTLAFLTIIFGKFGSLTAFRIVQAILQTLSLFLVFFIARKIFNSKVGVIAVIINFFYFVDIWVSNLILTETFFKFFVLLLVYLSLYAVEEKKIKYYVPAGIAWGLATLYRPTIATFPIVILIMWLFRKYSFKDIIKYTVVVALIFCTILSPWWIRNYRIFNRFIPLTLATGNPMLQGTFILYDQSSMKTDGLDYSQFNYTNTEMGNNETEMAVSKYRLKKLVPQHPIEYLLWYTVGKTLCQVGVPFYWVFGVAFILIYIYHFIILIFSILGIRSYYKDKTRNRMGTLLTATIIYFIAVYLPFYAFSRYFYPAMPLVIIFAAAYFVKRFQDSKLVRSLD